MTLNARTRPTGGFYALRYDTKEPGHYDATPVVSWADNGDGTAAPLTIKDIRATAILCPDQTVIEIKVAGYPVWPSIPDWIMACQGNKRPAVAASRATPALRDLGISGRACAPLERAGVKLLGDLQGFTKEDVAAIKGVSTETLATLITLMTRHKLVWKGESSNGSAATEPDADPEDDEDEDIM